MVPKNKEKHRNMRENFLRPYNSAAVEQSSSQRIMKEGVRRQTARGGRLQLQRMRTQVRQPVVQEPKTDQKDLRNSQRIECSSSSATELIDEVVPEQKQKQLKTGADRPKRDDQQAEPKEALQSQVIETSDKLQLLKLPSPRPLSAGHPLLKEMEAFSELRVRRRRYWFKQARQLGEDWDRLDSAKRLRCEEEDELADQRSQDLAVLTAFAQRGIELDTVTMIRDSGFQGSNQWKPARKLNLVVLETNKQSAEQAVSSKVKSWIAGQQHERHEGTGMNKTHVGGKGQMHGLLGLHYETGERAKDKSIFEQQEQIAPVPACPQPYMVAPLAPMKSNVESCPGAVKGNASNAPNKPQSQSPAGESDLLGLLESHLEKVHKQTPNAKDEQNNAVQESYAYSNEGIGKASSDTSLSGMSDEYERPLYII